MSKKVLKIIQISIRCLFADDMRYLTDTRGHTIINLSHRTEVHILAMLDAEYDHEIHERKTNFGSVGDISTFGRGSETVYPIYE